jgi:hypothetical protein
VFPLGEEVDREAKAEEMDDISAALAAMGLTTAASAIAQINFIRIGAVGGIARDRGGL